MRTMAGMTSMRPLELDVDEALEQSEPDLLALVRVELDREEVLPGERRTVGDPVGGEERRAGRVRGGRVGVGEVGVLAVERPEERRARRARAQRRPADVRQLLPRGQLRDLPGDEAEPPRPARLLALVEE